MPYRIAVDTGGTFTDVVVSDEEGRLHVGKAPTTRARAFDAIAEALAGVAEEMGLDVGGLLGSASGLTYGTTRATNAIVEGKTARTAFFTTAGFPDILLLREGGKQNPFRQMPYPPPYVPRHLTFEIPERVDSDGGVFTALDEGSVLGAIEGARRAGCEAVGVCLLWSTVNPEHELRVGSMLDEHWPGVAYTLSHRLNPIVREYRRASAAVIDASLKPLMRDYLTTMERDLREAGFKGNLLITTSYGGSWRRELITEKPIYTVGSGPSMAPVAAKTYAAAEFGEEDGAGDLVVCDTGGTTFDVGLVRDGEIQTTPETWLGPRWTGHMTGIRSVDVKSIGAGGGSIAYVDPGGLLHVGPQSAGAEPGPACYGRGGVRPTVTDAAVVLGYINPEYFLGGRLSLDAGMAADAIASGVGEPLGMSVEEAASAVLTVATENIVGATREITIAQGIDPREVSMVAGGGAAGLNVVPIARELGCRGVLVPSTAGALSACGALHAELVSEFAVSAFTETGDFDYEMVNAALAEVERLADEFFVDLGDMSLRDTAKQYLVEARYPMQVWELEVELPSRRLHGERDVHAMEEAFHTAHERVFAVKEPGQSIECVNWKVRARARRETPSVHTGARAAESPRAHGAGPDSPTRGRAYFPGFGHVEVERHPGGSLPPGEIVVGPAIIEEPTTTLVIYPESHARVTAAGNYRIEFTRDTPSALALATAKGAKA
ncbi:MAG: hydantoinase/oxoprolinase family protein [Streptosporangiales bacterium]|nr:hydantoinase/oxoprolinase family protein [Streptosporangiales bacterium]